MAPTIRARVTTYADEEMLESLREVADANGLTLSKTAEHLLRGGLKAFDESSIPITKFGK